MKGGFKNRGRCFIGDSQNVNQELFNANSKDAKEISEEKGSGFE